MANKTTFEKKSAREWCEECGNDSAFVATLALFYVLGERDNNDLTSGTTPQFNIDDTIWYDIICDYSEYETYQTNQQGRVLVTDEEGFSQKLFYNGKLLCETVMGARGGWHMSATTPDGRIFSAEGQNVGVLWSGWRKQQEDD
jgi:hypothetical protein